MTIILRLIYEFFKTGLFAVGGGLATLPFLYEMGENTGWFTAEDVLNLLAVSESTPGAIGINMSTYVGFLTAGVPGAIIATLALAAPSIIVIILVAQILNKFKESPLVQGVFKGLRPASIGLITAAFLGVAQQALLNPGATGLLALINWKAVLLAAVIFLIMRKWKVHPIAYIAIAAAVGILGGF